MEKRERYSILRPLSNEELELFSIEILNFFNPLNNTRNREFLGLVKETGAIRPLTYGDLLKYLKKTLSIDIHKYRHHLTIMIQNFTNKGFLTHAGDTGKGSPPLNKSYYSQRELTNLQQTNNFWLSNVLGEEYLAAKFKPFIIRFEGVYSNDESGTGSGVLINSNTILTCRHNLIDLNSYECFSGDHKLDIDYHKYHDKHDIGIVKLKSDLKLDTFPYFGQHYLLDNTLTLGYPPLRGMREAPLISQKGEINAISRDWNNCECITISSTVRPGNSGGPVVSMYGYIVGIVTQYANSASSVSADKDEFKDSHSIPFYNAITSNAIRDILVEIDEDLIIPFEDYN